MPRQPSIAGLHRKLTTVFNQWIRLRDTQVDADGKRFGRCISCGALKPYESLQAGHFIPANHYVHRYNPKNVNAQDVYCNKHLHGNPFGYAIGLRVKYDAELVWFLLETKDDKATYTREKLLEMIEMYTSKVKGMTE